MIKILHIIKSLGRGGAEMLLPETLKLHDKSKFQLHYIYFLPWKDEMVGSIKEAGGKLTCFPANNNIQIMMQGKKIIDYCKKNEIDLIHCHLPWAGFVGRYVFSKMQLPVIYTEHNLQERYHFITKSLNKFTYNSQTLAIGVSQDVTDSILRNLDPKIPVISLLNGVNTDQFRRNKNAGRKIRSQFNIPEDAVVIGNVAVFRFQKRIEEWVQIFSRLSELNSNIYGIIVGFGPLEKDIKAVVKKLNLENKIFFPGLQKEVKPFFSAMDIFMMSSSFEGLPIALLEAMSMECAIVATRAGGIKEAVRNRTDGLTCEVEQWKSLADLCQELINNPEEMRKYQSEARRRVVDSFSLQLMVDSLERIYIEQVSLKGN